jgi:predicted ABC-type ATPase
MKEAVIIGGPNGAGKTTSAFKLLPRTLHVVEFVNADEIARGLSPFDPESVALAAGRLMLDRIHELIEAGQSFALETTCASRSHARLMRILQAAGYRTTLLFLWLPSPKVAVARVARRVRAGGHRIPEDVIHRRFWAGLRNMRHLYLPLADVAAIYDNSDNGQVRIAHRDEGTELVVRDRARWKRILEASS